MLPKTERPARNRLPEVSAAATNGRGVKAQGLQAGPRRLTAGYLGGFYSLNGYYPGKTGHAAIANLTNADFAKPLPKYGPDANYGDDIYLLVTHAHEHLGQSIAYARVNGIVPPWTAEAAAKKAQVKDKD